jgi:hypothetical protein
MHPFTSRTVCGRRSRSLAAVALVLAGSTAGAVLPATGAASTGPSATAHADRGRVLLRGASLHHSTAQGSQPLTGPDDLTSLAGHLFVTFQNGVGPQGQASSSGNKASTVVEFTRAGRELRQWDITGHCDGLTADPRLGAVIATVNEDANSSLYLITPTRATPVHYRYSGPLPSNGGTDSIAVTGSLVLISASAPGTSGAPAPQARYPAVYVARLHPAARTVRLAGLFSDEAAARQANAGTSGMTRLALTDPDSSELVPRGARRFGGDFVLDSQGDKEQIFVAHPDTPAQTLSVLKLGNSINDSAWPTTRQGTLYVSDGSADEVVAVTGPFVPGEQISAVTPCDANGAPSTCPGPGYPANYLATVNPFTGKLTPMRISGDQPAAGGLLYLR